MRRIHPIGYGFAGASLMAPGAADALQVIEGATERLGDGTRRPAG